MRMSNETSVETRGFWNHFERLARGVYIYLYTLSMTHFATKCTVFTKHPLLQL